MDKFIYINDYTPSIVVCPIHGDYYITVYELKRNNSCPKCSKVTTKELINHANMVYKFKYKYYNIFNHRIKRISQYALCPLHGRFYVDMEKHASWDKYVNEGKYEEGETCLSCKNNLDIFVKAVKYKFTSKLSLLEKWLCKYLFTKNIKYDVKKIYYDSDDPIVFDFIIYIGDIYIVEIDDLTVNTLKDDETLKEYLQIQNFKKWYANQSGLTYISINPVNFVSKMYRAIAKIPKAKELKKAIFEYPSSYDKIALNNSL